VSVRAYEAVWDGATAKGGTLLVLLAIADHADRDTGVAWPSTSTLADMTRLEKRQVGRILTALDEEGCVDRWHVRDGRRWRTVYRLTLGPFAHLAGEPPLDGALPGPPPTGGSRRQDVASKSAAAGGVRGDKSRGFEATNPPAFEATNPADSGGDTSYREPSLEPSLEPGDRVRVAWLAEGSLIRHRESYFADPKLRKLVARSIDKYGADDVCAAIHSYGVVLGSDDYWWQHRWTLEEFLSRGLDRFVPEADPLTNYAVRRQREPQRRALDGIDRL
jgi:hypothetical protein